MKPSMWRRTVAIALALAAPALPRAAVAQTVGGLCLDVEPEVSAGRTGSPVYLVATLRKREGDSSACNGEMPEKGSPRRIAFELSGANDPDGAGLGSDTPESPDAKCQIDPTYYIEPRCIVAVWGDDEGTETVRAWIDYDNGDPPNGIVEADRTEEADKSAAPGNGCVTAESPNPSGAEPDCTDVVEIDWQDRAACEPATEPFGAAGRIAVYRSGAGVESGLYTIDHRGGDPRFVAAPEDLRAYLWSPDRDKLALTTGYLNRLELSTARVDGSDSVGLTDNYLLDEGAAWSPDSSRIVYASYNYRRNTPSQLKVVRATGGRSKWLTTGKSDSTQPDWSPNGKRIVYARYDIGSAIVGSVATIDPEGNHRRTLVRGKTLFEHPQYSPDGRSVLFRKYDQRTDARDLFVVDHRGHVDQVTDTGTFVVNYQWSPDGRKIVYATRPDTGWSDLRVVNADGSGDHRIVRHFGLDAYFSPTWSPDSSQIAYQLLYRPYDPDESRYLSDVWVASVDGSCAQAITSTPDITESAPSWTTQASTSNPFEF